MLNIPHELIKFSQRLDAKALLCSKTWEVLNEEGDKQVYIFQKDGILLISINGNVKTSTWQYIDANKSIIITADGQTTMLRPAFIDEIVFAMQKDGTQECLFLIDEQENSFFPNRTLSELSLYFMKKLEEIDTENRQREQQIKEQEQRQKELEKEELLVKEHQEEINTIKRQKRKKYLNVIVISGFLFAIFVVFMCVFQNDSAVCLFGLLSLIDIIIFGISIGYVMGAKEDAINEVLSKYK
ncbi:MAG: hypothetical protein II059_05920 [Clostridia bacterium]|nr:hypothetical protein [Clostridia bacterium]